MSEKNLDSHNRWRNITVAFRVSPEEDAQIETAVWITGLTQQDSAGTRCSGSEQPQGL